MQFKCMFRNSWKYLVNTKRMKNNKKNIKINISVESAYYLVDIIGLLSLCH